MVGHFVRLKIRLLANRLRTESLTGKIGFALIWVAGIGGGVLGGLAVFGLGRLTEEPGLMLMIAYSAVFAGWLVIPAAVSALDETLDARNFELLPLTPRRLTSGLIVAGAVGPGGLGTFVGLALATFASFPEWSLVPMLLLAVVVELLMCLLIARLVTTVLSNLLASRRTRELVTLVLGLGFGLFAVLPVIFGPHNEDSEIDIVVTSLDGLGFLAWLPPGALARSVSLLSSGELLGGVGLALYALAATALIGWAWAHAVRTMLVTAPTSGRQGRAADRGDRTLALVPSWLRVPPGPVMGLAAKELRYVVRDNRVRSQLLGSVVPVVVIVFLSQGSIPGAFNPFLAAAVSFLMVFGILANQFGADGGSFWGYVVSPAHLRDVVRGKNLGWGTLFGVVAIVLASALAVSSGDFSYLAAGILSAVAVQFVALAIGNITSIYGAYKIPEKNPFGTRGASGAVFVSVVLSMMAAGALLVPLVLLIGIPAYFLGPGPATVAALVGVGYGFLVYHLGMKLTSRLLVERQQTLLEVIDSA